MSCNVYKSFLYCFAPVVDPLCCVSVCFNVCVPVWAGSFACIMICCGNLLWAFMPLNCNRTQMPKRIVTFITCHRPSVCRHVYLPMWNIADHTGRIFVTFIRYKFTKVYWNIPHFGKQKEYAGRYIVIPEHIWHDCEINTNISVLWCVDRLFIFR